MCYECNWKILEPENSSEKKRLIAIEAYKHIVSAITDLEDKMDIYCELPSFIEVDSERFYKKELNIFSLKKET